MAKRSRSEHQFAAVPAEVTATGKLFAHCLATAASQAYLAPHPTLQPHLNPRLLRGVFVERRCLIQIVGDQVKIAIVVKIRHGQPVRDAMMREAELLPRISKPQLSVVAKQLVGRIVAWLYFFGFVQRPCILASAFLRSLQFQAGVHVHRVEPEPVCHQHVVVAVEVCVNKADVP